MGRRLALLATLTAMLAGCSPVYFNNLRPDFADSDRTQTLRLVVITSPLPDGQQAVGDVWSEIALHYANDHRDFIVKAARAAAQEPADLCGTGIDGVLHLTPEVVKVDGNNVTLDTKVVLTRCRDNQVVWNAGARGTWPSNDKGLVDVTEHYVTKYGAAVKPYVAPSFRLLKATMEKLPYPSIQGNDAAVQEKIESTD